MNYKGGLLAAAVLSICLVPAAFAHAILLSATPIAGELIGSHNTEVTLRFNSRVDARRSVLILVNPDGEKRKLKIGSQANPAALSTQVQGLKAGLNVLRWQVLAVDGHITR